MGDDPNQRGLSRKHIMHAIDDSLRRLQTDYVDLYQIHRFDYSTPIEETMQALPRHCQGGKGAVYWRFLHVCLAVRQDAVRGGARWTARFVTMQNHYNLVYREEEREMIPLCRNEGVGVIPWSPLARGFLAGNRTTRQDHGSTIRARTDEYAQMMYYQDSDFDVVKRVTEMAQKRGVKNAQVALAWVLQQPGITAPIVGASKMEHLEDAVKAMDLTLTKQELDALAEPYKPHPVLGHS